MLDCQLFGLKPGMHHLTNCYWKDSINLFKYTVQVTPNNYVFHNNLGVALATKERYDEAIRHFNEAVTIKPD